MTKIELTGDDFVSLVKFVTAFPSVGSFGGSELVSLNFSNGKLRASRVGLVMSVGLVSVTGGDLPLCAIDERALNGFLPICSGSKRVVIQSNEKEVKLQCKGREVTVPVLQGTQRVIGIPSDSVPVPISAEVAEKVNYLGNVAFGDSSRPELSCVLLTGDGRAVALNQTAIAVFQITDKELTKLAIPVPLAKSLVKGDKIYPGKGCVIVKSGVGYHSMPSHTKAQKEFPLSLINSYGKIPRTQIARCKGDKFAGTVAECHSVLGQMAKTRMIMSLTTREDRVEINCEHGGSKFRSTLPNMIKSNGNGGLRIPVEEIKQVTGFLANEDRVDLAIGNEQGESFVTVSCGYFMFPALRRK